MRAWGDLRVLNETFHSNHILSRIPFVHHPSVGFHRHKGVKTKTVSMKPKVASWSPKKVECNQTSTVTWLAVDSLSNVRWTVVCVGKDMDRGRESREAGPSCCRLEVVLRGLRLVRSGTWVELCWETTKDVLATDRTQDHRTDGNLDTIFYRGLDCPNNSPAVILVSLSVVVSLQLILDQPRHVDLRVDADSCM